MKAGETTLKPLLEGAKQYQVPIFQRSYIWGGVQLRQLWDDILAQYEVLAPSTAEISAARGSHFLGSFVLSPSVTTAHDVTKFLVVDGQQRMTTIMLALAALRDTQRSLNAKSAERIQNLYLWNQYANDQERYKLVPSRLDRDAFFRCIEGKDDLEVVSDSRVVEAYRFFKLQLSRSLPDEGGPIDLEVLERVLIDRLAVVDITVGADDNPNRIFESLNATGVDLTQADLLRNYLFMLLPNRAESVYDRVWLPMERDLGSENLEALARLDLLRRGIDARRDEIYRLQRERIERDGTDEASVVAAIDDLTLRARHYARLIEPWRETDPRIAKTLTRLKRWGAQTTYPLFMHLYDLIDRGLISKDEMAEASLYIESFIIRRQIGQVPTNQLNRLFTDMVKQLPKDKPIAEGIRNALSGERRYWLTDDQIRTACREKWFYVTGRADQRKLVLECIEESYRHLEPIDLGKARLTIEHVLPQTLSDSWRQEIVAQGDDPDRLRDELLHTIGNLTLTAYNGQLSNDLFERKRQIFKDSHLELNRVIAESSSWGRKEILARADELAERIIAIWPGPVAGARGAPVAGFDWSRIDAAVEAIPEGHWTTYGELAQMGATSPQPVGNRMASESGAPHAYRVLTRQGRVSSDFRWTNPEDGRNVQAVLEEEGVHFNADGSANRAQFLGAYDLARLIPYEFEPEELERLSALNEASVSTSVDGEPWTIDGRAWHLNRGCSEKTRPMLLRLIALIREAVPDIDPRWNQKYYVAWRLAGRNWLTVQPKYSWIWLRIPTPPLSAEEVATRLGFRFIPPDGSLSTSSTGPSQVPSYQPGDGLWIMFRNPADLEGDAGAQLVRILEDGKDLFLDAHAHPTPGGEPWHTNGLEWHLQHRSSAKTRAIVEELLRLIAEAVPQADGPHWNHKNYVAWELRGRNWMTLKTWSSWIWVRLHGTDLRAEDVARRLGAAYVPAGATPSWTTDGPVQVQESERVRGIRIMIRRLTDVQGPTRAALVALLAESAESGGIDAEQLVDEGDEDDEPPVVGADVV